jgi:hypothetical protein
MDGVDQSVTLAKHQKSKSSASISPNRGPDIPTFVSLLKGQDNSSSGNERYSEKLKTYTGSAPYLAQTLVPDFYKSNSAMKKYMEVEAVTNKERAERQRGQEVICD